MDNNDDGLDELLEKMAEEHARSEYICNACEQKWPCDARILIDYVKTLREGMKREMTEDIESLRVYYVHDSNCSEKNFTPENAKGLKTCLDCAGVFDRDGKGVVVTDKRFD